MNAEKYASFLRLMGHEVRESAGVYWFNTSPHIYMSFPFHRSVVPESVIVRDILKDDGWVLRFPCDYNLGYPSFRIIANDPEYDLHSLTGKARNQTRRGLESCVVKRVEFSELTVSGIKLNVDTLIRQGRDVAAGFEGYWGRYFENAGNTEGAEAWGAFVNERLAAYLIAFRIEGCANILIVRSASEFLKYYPNNALLFSYLKAVLKESYVDEVSIGLESVQAGMESLDRFKIGMGFKKEAIGQRILFRSDVSWCLKKPVIQVARKLVSFNRKDERFAKLEGMLRWFEEQPELV